MSVLTESLSGRLAEIAGWVDFYQHYGVTFAPLGQDDEVYLALGCPDGTHVEPRYLLACAAWWMRTLGCRYVPWEGWEPTVEFSWAVFRQLPRMWEGELADWEFDYVPAGTAGAVPVTVVRWMPFSACTAVPSRCPSCGLMCGTSGIGERVHRCRGCQTEWPAVDRPIKSAA